MSSNRCARCGRERAAGFDDSDDAATGAAWTSLEEGDVCPDCQRLDESRDAALRIAQAIQEMIERRTSEGIPPDEHERPLIEYAMETRAGFDPADDAGTTPESPPAPVGREDSVRLRVAFTGAFLTGHPLSVGLDGYESVQRRLGSSLKFPHWLTDDLQPEGGTYQSGGGLAEEVPVVIARRDGVDLLPSLAKALARSGDFDSGERRFAPVISATPCDLEIDVYDLGVAVITAWFDVFAAASAELAETARAVKRLAWLRPTGPGRSPLAEALQKIATATAKEYGAAVGTTVKELETTWRSRTSPQSLDENGRLLWLHPVSVVRSTEAARSVAKDLTPAFRKTIKLDGGVFAAGIGYSAVVAAQESSATTPVWLTKLHWAYYALYMKIDRDLLEILNQREWRQSAPLKQLEAQAGNVFDDYLRVMDSRARLDSYLSGIGGDELAIWQIIAKVQGFDAILDSVERKLEILEKVARRRVDQATADRSHRINGVLGYLSSLTLVAVIATIVGLVMGSHTHEIGGVLVRLGFVGIGIALASVVFWVTYFRTPRAKDPDPPSVHSS